MVLSEVYTPDAAQTGGEPPAPLLTCFVLWSG